MKRDEPHNVLGKFNAVQAGAVQVGVATLRVGLAFQCGPALHNDTADGPCRGGRQKLARILGSTVFGLISRM